MEPGFRRLLRLENAGIALGLAVLLVRAAPERWLVAGVPILPHLFIAGHAFGPRVGARCCNAVHSYAGPGRPVGAGALAGWAPGRLIAALRALHISIDRALGFGLKRVQGFGHTHLGAPGRG
ncbi:DUF4260 family protein (plasmid) [Paroceanicella profunda]|uniref:DUF4260 family protein n=1 Tax=Paroceanicella profunda TaxID=2579971 RepID=A0A5B8G436_9RHOB|nr:DUF4260 family protein [Paroceanicella profunda]QDL94199.1 DUF4260 family protein [Paroceanicella profunda]